MKASRKTRLLAMLLAVVMLMALAAPAVFAAYGTGKYRITASNGVNLRSGPGTDYAKLGAIAYNKVVNVIEVSGNWGKTTDGGVEGWFCLDYASFVGESGGDSGGDTKVSYKTTASINLRKGPGTSYERLTVIPQGAVVTVAETKDGWGKTTYGGYTGWFSLDYAVVYTGSNYSTGTYAIGYSTDLKKKPDASSETLVTLPLNTTVEVTEVSGDWGKTTYKGYTGWFNLQNAGTKSNSDDLTGNQRKDILIVAEKELGNTDGTKYTFGRGNVAWCAYFVSWCARQAGVPTSVIKTAGYARAYSHGVTYFHAANYLPSPGDLVYFDWPEYEGDMNHVGIVEKVTLNDAGTAVTALYTIEGNTSNSVARRSYTATSSGTYTKLANVSYYGIPQYETTSAKPVTDVTATYDQENETITVTWSASEGAGYYDVYLLPSGSNLDLDQVISHTRTENCSLTINGMKNGDYEVVVYARPGDASAKAASNVVKVTVKTPEPTYALTVVNGTGSGNYKSGEKVKITADEPAEGQVFIGWESSSGSFEDKQSASTTFTMPANAVTVEAKYAEIVHAEGLKLSADKSEIAINETITVKPTFTPSGVTDQRLTWSSGDNGIATVDAKGVVTGVSAGKVTIKAVSVENDQVSATIEISVKNETVTPTPDPDPTPTGEAYVTTAALNLRESASTSATKLATIPKGTKITITEVKSGWGKTTYSGKTGWVSMDYVKKADNTTPDPAPSGEAYVTTAALNLRESASTSSTKLTTIPQGTKITITEVKSGWGKTTYSGKTGWVSMDYVKKVDNTTPAPNPDPTPDPAPSGGTYVTTAALNLRESASTSSTKLTTIPQGTKITITEVKNGWGKTTYSGKAGWVSMDYVKKVEDNATPAPNPDPAPTGETYVTTAALNLRESGSTGATKLATIPQGTKITITEIKNGWGKTTYSGKTGWVSMDYVKKVENTNGSGTAYVTTAGLNLRESASTSAKKLATIPQGTKIIITEVKNGWGKTTYSGKTGWVSMDYVKKA